ncbi:MAG: ABC transporter ATP-binding protein [Treponema sp.]|nr:ABC transporter ATP-binding protein [Treponema sp.]
MTAVTAERLTKIHPSGKKALNNIDLSINEGDIFGFLGPNGAGKTTAVKVINGILRPSEGGCSVFGIDPVRFPEKIHALSGVVTEHAQMYNNLTGLQNLLFFGSVFGMTEDEIEKKSYEIFENLSLSGAKNQKLGEYSTGMRQRLSLARAMLHEPKILFLDEPTSGLDPESALYVSNLIKSLARDKGTTIFLCTHQLRYAEEICTRYGLISDGDLLASGTLDELHSQVFSGLTVKIKADKYPERPGIYRTSEYITIEVKSHEDIPAFVKQIVDTDGKVYHVTAYKHSLEEIYFAMIEKRNESNAK